MQPKLPLDDGRIAHMCLNADCFYCEAILDIDDLVWKPIWNSEIEDLDLIPHCPSCDEVIWREVC